MLKLKDGIEALNAMGQLNINIQPATWSDQADIPNIAAATKLTVYDAAYLHLSKKMNAKLITADSELKKKGENVTATLLLKELKI
ncbi:TPA: PIN domain-containing protein [Candidatus Bathyarchaeota archaeon]|nr:PIN domain-containing protein [Candidatus Bathyarchaeota archaeon]